MPQLITTTYRGTKSGRAVLWSSQSTPIKPGDQMRGYLDLSGRFFLVEVIPMPKKKAKTKGKAKTKSDFADRMAAARAAKKKKK